MFYYLTLGSRRAIILVLVLLALGGTFMIKYTYAQAARIEAAARQALHDLDAMDTDAMDGIAYAAHMQARSLTLDEIEYWEAVVDRLA